MYRAILIVILLFCNSTAQARTFSELQAAAISGDIDAQVELGYRYLYGSGVPNDLVEARRWLEVPVYEAQFPYAITLLGLTYWDETGTQADHEKAADLFGQAIELGDADAHIYLGWMIATGRGRIEDREVALKYISQGQMLGSGGAEAMMDELSRMPVNVKIDDCRILFSNGTTFSNWLSVERELMIKNSFKMVNFLCERSDIKFAEVYSYLGKVSGRERFLFSVNYNSCNMELSIEVVGDIAQSELSYDNSCHLYVEASPRASTGRTPVVSKGFFAQWADNMFGGAGENSASFVPCQSVDDQCFVVVEQSTRKVEIVCVKGPNSLYANISHFVLGNDAGKWGDDGFNYHYNSFSEAAYHVCNIT